MQQTDILTSLHTKQLYRPPIKKPKPPRPGSCAGAMASSTGAGEVQQIEGRLSWLVHIIGAIIQGRMSSNLGESQVHPLWLPNFWAGSCTVEGCQGTGAA